MGNNPFWTLVAKDNNVETLKEAVKAQEKIETEKWFEDYDAEEESSDDENQDEDGEDEDDKDMELFYFLDCTGSKAIFYEDGKMLQSIATCDLTSSKTFSQSLRYLSKPCQISLFSHLTMMSLRWRDFA